MVRCGARERGQGTVEYIGGLLLVALLVAAAVAVAGGRGPGTGLARALAERLICSVRLGSGCGAGELERALGTELAAALLQHAPEIRFEDGEFVSLPVDPRYCRQRSCSDSSERGRIRLSWEGEAATAFVHAIDCRGEAEHPAGSSCEGERSGHLYLQYWLYYPDSLTRPFGHLGGYHHDDWESYQVRLDPDGVVLARASSHHGHQYGPDALTDVDPDGSLGGARRHGWGPSNGYLWVSAGSHAGRANGGEDYFRSIRPDELRLIALGPSLKELDRLGFEVTPPWRKRVWLDPEHRGT